MTPSASVDSLTSSIQRGGALGMAAGCTQIDRD
jgi:hypothetical protein